MNAHVDLLPDSATPWMRMLAENRDPIRTTGPQFDGVRFAATFQPPQFLPWIIWQYGLGELTPYVPALNQLIDEGVRWQRVRGTPAAIYQGLAWIGYAGTLEESAARRKRWNRFQLHLSRVRDNDLPDLGRIDGIVSLSPPARSRFSRGFRGYDIRAAETSYQRTSGSLTSDHSGVYLPGIGAKWSFGRRYEAAHAMTETELTDLGTWIEPVTSGDLWADADYLWADADFAWAFPAAIARRNAIAAALIASGTPYIRFRAAGGAIIGHARAIAHGVTPALAGDYAFGSGGYDVTSTEVTGLMVLARTPFGAGAGQTATSMSIVFDGARAVGIDPGALWVPSSGITGGVEVAATTVSIPFGLTVRERPVFLLTF
jgi:hypothetical protein